MDLPSPVSDDDTKASSSTSSGRKYKIEKPQKSPRKAPVAQAKRGRKKAIMYEMPSPPMVGGDENTNFENENMGHMHMMGNMNVYSPIA